MAGVSIKLDGADTALAQLDRSERRAGNARGLYENIGAALVASTLQRFQTGVAPDGSPWPQSIRAVAEGGKTLIDTARLMQSITYRATDHGVEVGSNVVYAAIHQLGGDIKQAAREQVIHFRRTRGGSVRFSKANKRAKFAQKVEIGAREIRMPARPFLGVDQDDKREIADLVGDWILRKEGIE